MIGQASIEFGIAVNLETKVSLTIPERRVYFFLSFNTSFQNSS